MPHSVAFHLGLHSLQSTHVQARSIKTRFKWDVKCNRAFIYIKYILNVSVKLGELDAAVTTFARSLDLAKSQGEWGSL